MSLPAPWGERIADALAAIDGAGLTRRREPATGPCAPRRRIRGKDYLSFASNDYLGLAGDPRIAEALAGAVRRHGVGSGASQLLGGYTDAHAELEETLARWVGQPRALLFTSGFQANLALATALAGPGDLICQDRLNHASLIDAARLSGARLRRYLHGDPESLAGRLARVDGQPPADRGERRASMPGQNAGQKPGKKSGQSAALVMTDAVFSMDGDIAPLAELQRVAQRHAAFFYVDDAHGLGVLGESGAGACEAARVCPDALMGTFGKSLGTFGAFVAGPAALVELLVQRARSYIYTTAPPPALAVATSRALALVREESWRRDRLGALVSRFRLGAEHRGLPLLPSETPIQPVPIGTSEQALAVSRRLREQGLWVPAIRPPTVPRGGARLRVTLTAAHEEADVDRLLDALAAA